ncbi:hypothetical protein HK100_002721 [Physocladia obscura]|uniref:Uncharacterized protein n=1 Tax=Physocladia obscura TaxID=109957 RepID=A0AAD5T8L7_9FUNG|nr:hypothetical protein HK100_002721 [Physocladia obscura]
MGEIKLDDQYIRELQKAPNGFEESTVESFVTAKVFKFLEAQNELAQKIYMLHTALEFLIGATIAGMSQYTNSNLYFQTPMTCLTLLVLYAAVMGLTASSLYSSNTKKNYVICAVSLTEFIIAASMFFVSLVIFGLIALANNVGMIYLVRKQREVLPEIMDSIGIKMEEENCGEGSERILKAGISWSYAVEAYLPILVGAY